MKYGLLLLLCLFWLGVSVLIQSERKEENPVSLNTPGINEIQRNPGARQNISIVIQSLPGVASTPNFRNDIIIRGGGPNENKFFWTELPPASTTLLTRAAVAGPFLKTQCHTWKRQA